MSKTDEYFPLMGSHSSREQTHKAIELFKEMPALQNKQQINKPTLGRWGRSQAGGSGRRWHWRGRRSQRSRSLGTALLWREHMPRPWGGNRGDLCRVCAGSWGARPGGLRARRRERRSLECCVSSVSLKRMWVEQGPWGKQGATEMVPVRKEGASERGLASRGPRRTQRPRQLTHPFGDLSLPQRPSPKLHSPEARPLTTRTKLTPTFPPSLPTWKP